MGKQLIGRATLGRLPKYLEFLKECNDEYISSAYVAKSLYLGEVQVRKDLSAVSGKGKPRVGYKREELIADLEKRTGLKIIKVEVGAIDFLKDAAIVKMYYKSNEASNSVDTTLKTPTDEYKLK